MAPAAPWRLALASALILATSAVLAGCVGTASAASAKDWQSPADEAAHAWSANAQLVQVIGAEGTFPMEAAASAFGMEDANSGDADWSGAHDDESVGDGLASVWLYRYTSDEKDMAYAVLVGKDGKVLDQAEEARDGDDVPLGEWTLDSDAALEAALAANEDLRTGVERENYGIGAFLTRDGPDDAPQWFIGGMGGDSVAGGGGFVILDATTGEVLENQGMSKFF